MPTKPPTTKEQARALVESLFRAMHAGPPGEEEMVGLFTDDAEFVEPFEGAPKTHRGKPGVRKWFRGLWEQPGPALTLALDRIDVDGPKVRAEWTCTSPAWSGPMKGLDLLTLRDGKIARLEIVITQPPPEMIGGPPP